MPVLLWLLMFKKPPIFCPIDGCRLVDKEIETAPIRYNTQTGIGYKAVQMAKVCPTIHKWGGAPEAGIPHYFAREWKEFYGDPYVVEVGPACNDT